MCRESEQIVHESSRIGTIRICVYGLYVCMYICVCICMCMRMCMCVRMGTYIGDDKVIRYCTAQLDSDAVCTYDELYVYVYVYVYV